MDKYDMIGNGLSDICTKGYIDNKGIIYNRCQAG